MTQSLYSIINLSECVDAKRIDAEYFKPEYLENQELISRKSYKSLDDASSDIKSYGAYSLTNMISYEESGIPYIRCTDVKSGFVDFSQVLFVDEKSNELLWKSEVKKDMVLLCMSGTVGNSAVASDGWQYPVNSNQDVAKIVLKRDYNPYYVSTFFNCKYGRSQVLRLPIGSVQQHVFIWQLKTLTIPDASEELQSEIENLVRSSENMRVESANKLTEANQSLLSHLDFANFTPSTVNYSSRSSKDATAVDRLDGEFWMPKYDEIIERLTRNAGSIGDYFDVTKGTNVAYSEEGNRRVIKTKQLKNLFIDTESIEDSTSEGTLIKDGSMLFASMGVGSLGKADMFYQDLYPGDFVTDSTIFTVKPKKDFYAEYLLCLIRNTIYQQLIYRYIVGSSGIISISKDKFLALPVPKLDENVQNEMKNGIIDSHNLLSKSKQLLEVAKRAVEVFIEEDEAAALEYIKQNYEQV